MRIVKNMYVRYNYENMVYMGQIKFVSEAMGFYETLQLTIDNCMEEISKEGVIGQPSFNQIELIEVGDYVNGVEVMGFEIDNLGKKYIQCGVGDYITNTYYESEIKTIVTKEQFESMEYRIGG